MSYPAGKRESRNEHGPSFKGLHPGPMGPVLPVTLCYHPLEIPHNFLTKGPRFAFALGPTNYVAAPGLSRPSAAAAYKISEAGQTELGGLGHSVLSQHPGSLP